MFPVCVYMRFFENLLWYFHGMKWSMHSVKNSDTFKNPKTRPVWLMWTNPQSGSHGPSSVYLSIYIWHWGKQYFLLHRKGWPEHARLSDWFSINHCDCCPFFHIVSSFAPNFQEQHSEIALSSTATSPVEYIEQ